MNFLIVGAGAIGGYVGGSLALAGHTVTFSVRPTQLTAFQRDGLRVQVGEAVRQVGSARWVGALSEGLSEAEVIVLALKSFDTAAFIQDLLALTQTPPPILCLQNGVDNEPALAQAVGAERVIAGTVTTAVSKPTLNQVQVERLRGIGVALEHPLSQFVVEALNAAGLRARVYPAAGPMKWTKLLTNLLGNATAAILDLPVRAIFADRRLCALELAMMRECLAVMKAQGNGLVDLPGTSSRSLGLAMRVPQFIAQPFLRQLLGRARGDKMPSLHIDLHSGRKRTEIQWLHGAVVRHGAALGVPTPINQLLATTVEQLGSGALRFDDFRHRPEALLKRL